ncbi:transcriptional regulator [Paenochrobactrum pullorum]|uniref:transcriptional regulator n=1 Tax=Paenochrobactrum pullorum TaxID=1324351 RepID=UPI0035BC5DB2
MADFVAVLKKTIDAQADPTPELRQRVYAKARATIEQKLVTANAPESVSIRQRQMLEDSIKEVEAFYAPAPVVEPEPEIEPETKFEIEPEITKPADPLEDFLSESASSAESDEGTLTAAPDFTAGNRDKDQDTIAGNGSLPDVDLDKDRLADSSSKPRSPRKPAFNDALEDKRTHKGLIIGLIAAFVIGGGGYAAYVNKDTLSELASSLGRGEPDAPVAGGTDTPATTDKPETPDIGGGTETGTGTEAPDAPEPKLTQRLLPDGTEVDEGPAGGVASDLAEGKSTTALNQNSATGQAPVSSGGTEQAGAGVAVGQKAFFYEERSGAEDGSAQSGSVVWSVVQDSPGDGEPEEPAIRAEVTIPDTQMRMQMTIRRNADKSLPASHLIEMMFFVPDDFSGGVVDNVQRITFKDTEQAAGNPLIAISSKIADNFFIVALNDARTAVDTNLSLMRRLQWVDIPITYRNGRRALLSLEKGVPGEKVFNDVLKSQ